MGPDDKIRSTECLDDELFALTREAGVAYARYLATPFLSPEEEGAREAWEEAEARRVQRQREIRGEEG